MDDRTTDELRMLRTRAYGPDADIEHDLDALVRLRELEASGSHSEDIIRPPVDTVEGSDEVSDTPGIAEEAHDVEPPHRARPLRWGATTLIAAMAVVAIVTAAVTTLVVRDVEAHPLTVGTLGVDPTLDLSNLFGQDDREGTGFQDFYGLTPVVPPTSLLRSESAACLVLAPTAELNRETNGWSGVGGMTCEAGPFPASVQFIVKSAADLPDQLRERFPDGTALRFVLEGASVVVLSDSP